MHYLKPHKTLLYSLTILVAGILAAPAALAQTPPCSNPTTVTIGNGSSTNQYLGGYSYYKYSYTEQIYRQSEIEFATPIYGMEIRLGSAPSPSRQIRIYLGHTSQTSVPNGWAEHNDLTLVWDGSTNYTPDSWYSFTFTTPFQYNGTDNLLLVIIDHTGNYSGSSYSTSNKVKTHDNGSNLSRYAYYDYTEFSITNLPTYSNSNISSTNERMNVLWHVCSPPCGSIQNLTVGSVGTNSAFINWELVNASATTQVTLTYDDNPNFSSPQSVVVSGNPPYALTGLTPNTTYYVRATLSCDEGTSNMISETSFTTDPMPCAEYSGSSTITIGNGTGTETHLWGAYLWNYSFSEQIYRHSELGGAASITGMAVQLANAGRERHLLIYLGHTSQSSVDSWIMPSDLTLVWSGTTAYTANSWNEVPFNAPFQYNGTDNLLLLIVDESGYWGGGETSARIHDNTGYYSRYIYSDNDTYSASSLPSGTGTSLQKRANVRWYFDNCITPADCDIPAVIVEDVGEQSAVVRWTDVNGAPYRVYISTGNATPTLVGTTSDTSYTLNGLEGNTTYQVRIYPQCTGATTEPYASAQFTTPLCNNFTTISIPQTEPANATTNSYLWGYSYYKNAFTEQIFRHEEMDGAVHLIGMSIHVGSVAQDRQISIYLGHTDQTSVPSNWIIPDDLTQVWSGTTDYTAQSWNDIIFETPFDYNGTDNLLLVLVDHNSTYSSGNNTFVHDNGNYSSRYAYNDYTTYSISNPPTSGTAITQRMNVRWMGCASPCGNVQNLTVSDIGANSATINWTTANQSPNSQVVLEYADNPNFTSSQSVTVTSAPPFLLTGLEPLTTYYIRANIICDEGSSSFASAQFSTPLCDEPNIQTIGNGTTTTPYLWGNSEYNRTFSQQIYRQSELGIPRTLYSMDIQVGAAGSNREISIYLGHTNLNSVPQGWIVPEDLTLVWSGTTHYTPNSWNHIIFNTPFAYNGEDNLLLVFVDHTGSSESAPNNTTILHRNGNYHSRYIYGNNTTYNAFSPPHISSTVTASYYRMNVRWYGCIDPCGAIQNLTVSDIDVNSATLNWTVYNPSSTAQVTLEYADNPNFTSSQSITVTGNPPFTLTNLEPNTTYYVRVHLDCAEGAMAGFASTHFSTPIQYIIIDDIDVPEELCGGTSEQIVIGFNSDNGITIQTPKQTLGYYERVFLPDGTECDGTCYYLSSVTFDAFPEEATISSVEDIEYIRVNLEHSWIGDLYMAITCPNGNSVSLMNYSGGNTTSECYSTVPSNHIGWTGNANYYWNADFGIPVNSYSTTAPCNPNATGNAPGIGWNYCWSENTSYEYAPSNALIYGASTSSDIRIDSSNVSAGTNFYHPNQSFSDLIGCPLNGTWSIEVIDASNEDNGYIFGWDMTLSSSMVANNLCPIQEILLNGPYVNRVNDTIFTIDVPSDLAEEETAIYSLSIITSCGFQIDTSITIQLHPSPSIIDVQKHCDSYTWNGVTYTESTNTPTYHSFTAAGCDSNATLNLTINPSYNVTDNQTKCDSYEWNGTTYTQSTTQTATLISIDDCDSVVTLNLTINHNAGSEETLTACDSYTWPYMADPLTSSDVYEVSYTDDNGCEGIHKLNLTIHPSYNVTDNQTSCVSYTWNGTTYTQSTVQTATMTAENGCDSIVTLNLTIHPSYNVTDNQTACVSYAWNGTTYTQSTVQTATLTSINGCDSTVTLHLTIHPSYTITDNQTACDSYIWNGSTYTQSTVQTATLTSTEGCDSTVTLNLTIHPSYNVTDNQTACVSYTWNGTTYTQSTVQTATLTAANGCDSTVTLNLTIHPSYNVTDNQTACVSYAWNGTTYTQSTVQTATLTSINGCDSVVTLHLTILPSYTITDNQTACDSYTWNGSTYTQSTVQTATLTSTEGCDSTVTLNLTIHPSYNVTDNQTACDSYSWQGTNYSQSTIQTITLTAANSCDSTVTLHLTVNYSTSGIDEQTVCDSLRWHGTLYTNSTNQPTYHTTNAAGCDSTTTLHLTVNHHIYAIDEQNVCDSLTWHGNTYHSSTIRPTYNSTSSTGCDSTTTLHLTVRYSSSGIDEQNVCDNYSWHGTTYTQSTDTPIFLSTNAAGCDSTTTLHLTVRYSNSGIDEQTACDSYSWHGTTYTTSTNTPTYQSTNAAGCDSTTTLHLTVNYSTSSIDEQTVCDSLRWHGALYTNSTNQPTYHTTNAAGCDSTTTLHLTVNHHIYAIDEQNVCDSLTWHGNTYYSSTIRPTYNSTSSTGCDSTTTLHLTVRYSSSGIDEQNVCDSYSWHGTTYTQSTDTPIFLSTNAAGCDSTTTLHLTVRHSTSGIDEQTACDNYSWHGVTYTSSTNTPTHQSTNAEGCDSTTTLHLTINHSTSSIDEQSVCDSLVWHGRTYHNTTNRPTYQSTNAAGCDSTVTLHLTVRHSTSGIDVRNACDSLVWHGTVYRTSTNSPIFQSINAEGCDSTVTLHLTVHGSTSAIDERDVCDSLTWHGTTYTASTQTPIFHSSNAAGCDSTTTLHLTVRHSTSSVDVQDVCDRLRWHGTIYTTSTTTPTYHSTNTAGCDSTVTLHLTVRHSTNGVDEQSVCDSLTWHGTTYRNSTNQPTYQSTNAAGCDSTTTLHLTVRHSNNGIEEQTVCDSLMWHGTVYRNSTNNPIFQSTNAEGCDSITTLHLTVNYSSSGIDVQDVCDELTWHGTTYTQSTDTPTFHSTNAAGCDSTTTLHLTVRHSSQSTETFTVCDSMEWHGTVYRNSTSTATYQSTNAEGCDSIVTLHLTVNHSTHDSVSTTACEQYTWHGETFDTNGIHRYDYTDHNGCESSETLYLRIVHGSHDRIEETACGDYRWHQTDYTESGVYTYDYNNADGCASTDTLYLTVLEISHSDTSAATCVRYFWQRSGMTYTESGVYVYDYNNEVGCPSHDTLHLTIFDAYNQQLYDTICEGERIRFADEIYDSSGDYTAQLQSIHGCDSTVTLHLFVRSRPQVEIEAEYGCPTEQWELKAITEAELITWTANTGNHQLNGHEHDTVVRFHAQDTTLMTLTADYATGHSCPNNDQVTLKPIVKVTALIECRPEVLSQERPEIEARDISSGNTTRQWYVDGVAWGNDPVITCTADKMADEMILLLIVNNEYCADTTERILVSTNESIFIPNIFTPTQSTNSTFRAHGSGILEFKMSIYNREGLLVFSSNDISTEWDGTHNGEPCPQGSYVYQIRFRGRSVPDGWQTRTGAIMLLR